MKLKLNREYAQRHLFVTILMLGLCIWFGYDGFIRYPATEAAQLYVQIEGREAPEGYDLEAFKRQKIQTQYGFTLLSLLAAAIVGCNLLRSAKFDFEHDDEGFSVKGEKFKYSDIVKVDRSSWQKKGIIRIFVSKAKSNAIMSITLDAWHHIGVKEIEPKLPSQGN